MFSREKINYQQYTTILETSESYFSDFKDKSIAINKLAKTISAFANSEGGDIYIGIREEGDNKNKKFLWQGFEKEEDANSIIQVIDKMLGTNCFYCATFLQHGKQGLVLHIQINQAMQVISTPSVEVYLRRNAYDQKLNHDEIERLKYSKGIVSYENISLKDIDVDLINSSDTIYEFLLAKGSESNPEDFLRKNNLIDIAAGKKSPKVSGILLFCDYPQAYVSRCSVKVVRYNTSSETPQRTDLCGLPETIEGNLYKLIHQAVKVTQDKINEIPASRDGSPSQYPHETLHEIITNAVLHRDYSIKDVIQIKIFNNRVEVVSPGSLPAHITRENILEERFSRNPTLVRLINKFKNPPNKDIGEGLNTAFHAMKERGLIHPKILVNPTSVTVSIINQRIPDSEKVFLSMLESHGELTGREINRKEIFENQTEQKKIISRLIKDGVVKRESQGLRTVYLLNQNTIF